MKRLCSIYKSPKKDEMYLYVDRQKKIKELPGALLKTFGSPVLVTHMFLSPEKNLSRVDAVKVLDAIEHQGFFLQLPPQHEDFLEEHKKSINYEQP